MPEVSPYIIVPVVTIIVSQIIKFAIHGFSNEIDFGQLLKVGGNPSSAIAAAVSVAVTALAVDGPGASVAGLTVVLVGFYVYERLATVGRRELALGALVGFISAAILSVEYWRDDIDWFFQRPVGTELTAKFIGFAGIFLVAEALSAMTRRKSMRKLPTSRKLNRAFRLSLTLPAVLGLFFVFAQRESLGMFDTRIWTGLVIVWIIGATAWFWRSVYRHAKAHLAEEAEHFKKAKAQVKTKRKKTTKKSKRKK